MLIGFDASRAFVPEHTGTENYSLNLLKALAKVDRKNRYRVYLRSVGNWDGRKVGKFRSHNPIFSQSHFPSNFEFVHIRPNRLWTQVGLALETWRHPVDVLFVPAHTLPIFRRRKIFKFQFPSIKSQTNSNLRNSNVRNGFNLNILNLDIVWSLLFGFWNFLLKETKYVVTIHDLGVEYLPNYHKFPPRYYLDLASKYAARHADAVIAVSAATKRDLIGRYGVNGKKVRVVHEGVDKSFFRRKSIKEINKVKIKYKIEGNYLLFVGTIQPRKNLEMLIRAFSEAYRFKSRIRTVLKRKTNVRSFLQTGRAECQLVFAGKLGWDWKGILSAPKKYGVQKRVKFLNYVDRSDLPALYSGARVFVFPSLFEGFGLPILEALACGTKVIASDIEPHREILNKLQVPITKIQRSKNIRNWQYESVFSINQKLEIENSHSERMSVPIVLVKPNSPDDWSKFLYQEVSQYSKRQINVSKIKYSKLISYELERNFSWEESARRTLAIFSNLAGLR